MIERVPDEQLGKACIGPGVGAAIRGTGLFPALGDLDDGVPRFLMGLRGDLRTIPGGPGVRNEPRCWDFPGGGVDFGEELEVAVRREVREEIGVHLSRVELIGAIEQLMRNAAGEVEEHWISLTHVCDVDPHSHAPTVPYEERTKVLKLRFMTISEMRGVPLASSMAPNIALIQRLKPHLVA